MAMASDGTQQQYLLPPLSELLPAEPLFSWNLFRHGLSASRDRGTDTAYEPVGLGITQPSDAAQVQGSGHARSDSDVDTVATPNRFSGSANSQTTLLGDESHAIKCPTRQKIVQRRLSWVPLTVLVLAVYSTVFSGIYLVVALVKPRYGGFIGVNGRLAASTANLLSALFAKTIELAYVTVCVAFLGQVLSRRAITKGSRGISISDMSMRSWIMQPGSMIVHWETLRYSGWTILGVITLTATLVAMLYTTAAEALVSPKLVMGPVENTVLVGDVYTSFANPYYLAGNCKTPIPRDPDPEVNRQRGITCLDMRHAGEAYRNYQIYLQEWSQKVGNNSAGTSLESRPRPTGSVHDNTTVTGSWVNRLNTTELSIRHGRMVHNVTAAMPHGGIMAAATKPENGIRQPKDLSGEGNYQIDASVPSPAVNVLCVGMNATELAPLVYTEWPNTEGKFDAVSWPTTRPDNIPSPANWKNRTVVDDIFGFGPDYDQLSPIFGKLPKPYNTILNITLEYPENAIYLLGATPENTQPPYVLCSLKAKQTPFCSTRYDVTASGAHLTTVCDDPATPLQYSQSNPSALDGHWAPDWKNVASEWSTTLSLNTGITDANSSNARLLMQFVPNSTFSLNPSLPCISEALAVLAGNTLIMSSTDAPFVPFWNYTNDTAPNNILPDPVTQSFNASLRTVQYASSGSQDWQAIFYPILFFAFVTSAVCLAFMLFEVRGRQLTDFTEPLNLFALAVNSPASERLRGACGAGPQGPQLKERWFVAMEEGDDHYYIRTKAEENTPRMSVSKMGVSLDLEEPARSVAVSPAMEEYRRLAQRRSLLSRFY